MEAHDLRRRLLAILAADVAGYSRLMSVDDGATVAALDASRAIFREHIAANGGRVIDMAGDSVLSVFETANGAMVAALAVQRQLAMTPVSVAPEARMQFRIGIHVGDVIEKADGTVYGDGVNIAARLEGLAEPGAVAVSAAVHGMVARHVDADFQDIGEQSVKNIAEPVRAFRARPRRRGDAEPTRPAVPVGASPRRGNLPALLPVLFGRDIDVEKLSALVLAHRLVTIVGAGGIGKTRLAEAMAHALREAFADGVWMVELAPLVDASLVPAAVAQAVGVTLPGRNDPQAEVIDALRERALLLVLDNCEHLVHFASQFVTDLTAFAPRCHVLATSQELLKAPMEHVYRLDGLNVPATLELPVVRSSGAVALFTDCVGALQPGFELTERNVADVVDICGRLDGLPLAIELAAARVPLLGVSGVREHLQERFVLLTQGARSGLRRHHTLREALDWSHGLLTPDERVVFRRSGVFFGGFTLSAAQQTMTDEGLSEWAVLDHIGALVDKSLLVTDADDPPRCHLLESARDYALEKLAGSGELPLLRDRHAAYFLAAARAAEPHLTSSDRGPWLTRLRADLNNFRAAQAWLQQERADAAQALPLAGALAWFAYFDGLYREGRAWIEGALALPGAEAHRAERAAALSGAARLAAYSGDATAALAQAEESQRLWREVGDVRGLAYALFHDGIASIVSGRHERARRVLDEALAGFRSLDDAWGIALGASYLGAALAVEPGAEEQARTLLLEGRSRFRALGDDWGMTVSSHYLGTIALRTGDHAMARELTEEMLVNARKLGDKYRMARNLHQLAEICIAEGQPQAALRQLHESLVINCQQGRLGDAAQQLRLFARVAIDLGAPVTATRLAAVAERYANANRTMPPDDPQRHVELLARLQQALGQTRYRDECARAGALSLEEAAALALTLESQLNPPA